MQNILESFFAESAHFCGSEKTLHALFCHHLVKHGRDPKTISREFRLQDSPVDVVISGTDGSRMAIEFKGGAYGNRNALFDTVDREGHCKDLDKLEPFAKAGMECWFICVDMAELGVALGESARLQAAAQCRRRNINFAYYCHGESRFLISDADEGRWNSFTVAIDEYLPGLCELGSNESWITPVTKLCHGMDASEDTYSAWLYHALRNAGLGPHQVSLETYFNCAAINGSRMQLRPDLVIFAPDLGGKFNLYKNGDRKQPNDAFKMRHLLAIIEVKGSQATGRLSDARFAAQVKNDLYKLANWRKILSASHPSGRAAEAAYIMIVADKRQRAESMRVELAANASAAGVELAYLEACE